jgi:integrase
MLSTVRLSQLTAPMVRAFEDRLAAQGRSPAMVHRVMVSLGSIVADAFERGLVAQNVVRGRPQRTRRNDRRKPTLLVGTHIPTPKEIRNLIPHLQGRWRPLFLVAAFTGLRASELCGLVGTIWT